MKLDNGTLPNCTYRYISTDPQTTFARWVDGPCTSLAAILALTGTVFAAKFLWKAGLNKHLTAALFSLCIVDSLLMCTVIFSYSIEAIGMVFLGTNVMYKNQGFTTSLHGVASSMTTSSTLLVIYITFQRFMVVIRPLRYANALQERSTRSTQRRMTQISIPGLKNRKEPSSGDSTQLLPTLTPMDFVRELDLRKILKPYLIPLFVVLLSFAINIPVHFEFTIEPCWDWDHKDEATCPAATLFREDFARYKAVLNTLTQTVGPVATISLLTLLTEMKVHRSLKERRKLFESQKRSRAVVLTEELKEKVSRTVSIFIAVKFLILRASNWQDRSIFPLASRIRETRNEMFS
ncbi:unnamed protein product, partial [Mesorhabditis belari]|uniref:G-protein coupled receptors family 1 profile domain-containing protein n=1 Tax=Mesorhabditis belari TaxID=2138241 RepID=A0AAF3FH93_9BILA